MHDIHSKRLRFARTRFVQQIIHYVSVFNSVSIYSCVRVMIFVNLHRARKTSRREILYLRVYIYVCMYLVGLGSEDEGRGEGNVCKVLIYIYTYVNMYVHCMYNIGLPTICVTELPQLTVLRVLCTHKRTHNTAGGARAQTAAGEKRRGRSKDCAPKRLSGHEPCSNRFA